jgi:hypothetical protein
MSWLTEQADKAIGMTPFTRKRFDPVGDAADAFTKLVGNEAEEAIEEEGVPSPLMKAGDVDPNAKLGPLQNLAKASMGRKFHNINKKGASILTTV